jgi:hypothetical protein
VFFVEWIMHRNLTNDEIISNLQNDPLFKNAEKYKILLQYLYKCYQSDKIPTEFDIAADVFYKDKDFNPAEDTTVRVYIYRLRKKLDEYYEGPGKHDPIVIQIQKGTYHIEFLKHSELNKRKVLKFKQYLYPAIVFILLVLIAFLSIKYISVRNQLYKNDDIRGDKLVWSDFTSNGLPTIYAIGSLYAYYYYLEQFDRSWLVRDDAINNELELNDFEEKYHLDKNNISIPDWKIIPKSAALHYGKLLPIFQLKTSNLELKPTDELKWNDIENNNIIYVGHFHNLNILNSIFPRNRLISQVKSAEHGVKKYFIEVKTSEIDTLYPIILSENKSRHLETDYVVVSKIPGPRNNVILFICSFSSMGRLKLIETLTSAKMLSELEQNILKTNNRTPKYFEMLVKVSGFLDRGLETTIMHFFELPSDFVLMKEQSPF